MADPYKVLGVERSASPTDIKKAYRTLAKKFHPDVNKSDKGTAQKFQEISHAYELLSDPKKKEQYDRGEIDDKGNPKAPYGFHAGGGGYEGQQNPFSQGFQFDGSNFFTEDLFSNIFGGGRRAADIKGEDLSYILKITFIEAALGVKKTIVIADGKNLELNIPSGTEHGKKLRLKGKGKPGKGRGPTGDAFVEIHVAPHPYFTRKGLDIYLELPLSLPEAVIGASINVPTIHGKVALRIPSGSSSGSVMRLKGKGIHAQEGEGDQYLTLKIVLPSVMDEELKKFMETWDKKHSYEVRKNLS
jgi:DnaJ-class molecular chaperone